MLDDSDNRVEGNLIGTNLAGTVALANGEYGVLFQGSTSDTIGGTAAGRRNVISGNGDEDVYFDGASDETVQANYIGTDVTGSARSPPPRPPEIYFESGSDNLIGGSVAGAGNVISGNALAGVEFTGAGTTDNLVQGNLIGTNAAGTAAVKSGTGVEINFGATGNTIGGLTTTPGTGAGNLISGSAGSGVYLNTTSSNLVEGNLIGTNLVGSTALANADDGVVLELSSNDTIGGTAAGARNVIGGNAVYDVYLDGASDETVQGNYVGTDVSGSTALSTTTQYGILLLNSSDNLIGGSVACAGNVISGQYRRRHRVERLEHERQPGGPAI